MPYRFLIVLFLLPLFAQGQRHPQLKRELDSMYVLDQQYRKFIMEIGSNQHLADSLMTAYGIQNNLMGKLWEIQSRIDSLNLVRAEAILRTYGYPGKSLVGTPSNEAVWYIIQHSSKIDAYFPQVKKAGRAGELPMYLVGMMEDRLLTEQLKPQIYGSQVMCYPLLADSSRKECFVWPIENPSKVNERRKKAGFTQSVEENTKRFGLTYTVISLQEARKRYKLH